MLSFCSSLALGLAALALAGCGGTTPPDSMRGQLPSEQENHHELCQKWTGDPNDPNCLNTFRRILP